MGVKRQLKTGVRQGHGPPPGYEWSIVLIDFVYSEAIEILGEMGYQHIKQQFKEMALDPSPTQCVTVDVAPIEDFYELRDKGWPFGGANVRVFFGVDATKRRLVVIGSIKKQNNGPTKLPCKVRMRRRWRDYRDGKYGDLPD